MAKYKTAEHTGGLKECLETEKPITEKTFKKLIGTKIYKFYAYDNRIKANIYILTDMENNYGLPTWIHEYKDR